MEIFDNIENQLPYDPSDVDIRQQNFTIHHLMQMISFKELELWHGIDYQRNSSTWSYIQKSRLIESLLMRIPLPIFYFDGSERPWKIIDGLHRLSTLYSFIEEEKFALKELEYLKDLEGLRFSELSFQYRRMIEESLIQAYVINPGTPDKVKLNIFQRINTGGSSLSRQEIRNAYYRGLPSDFIDNLAISSEFLTVTNNKISSNRMRDKEVVLRFFAFYKFLDRYIPPMERFLDYAMESIYEISHQELNSIEDSFNYALNACMQIFEEKAFYVLNMNGEKQGSRINIALFESWVVNLALLPKEKVDDLLNRKNEIFNDFVILLQDIDFHKSFSSSTSSRKAVEIRFFAVRNILNNFTNAN